MFYQVESICSGLWRIWDVSRTAFYLVEGENAAVLIDSGIGVGKVRAVVQELTQKPVSVWLTHGHMDHAMGAAEYDEIHMNLMDLPIFDIHTSLEMRQGYVTGAAMMGADPTLIAAVQTADFCPAPCKEALLPISDGQQVDLGGVHLRFIGTPGHTPGSMTVLIEEWRILILGDACNAFTYLFDPWCPTVEEYRQTLLQLKAQTDGKYDKVLFNHGNGDGALNMIDNVIKVCDDILAGHSDAMPFYAPNGDSVVIAKAMDFQHFCRVDGGEGNLVYRPDGVC